MKLIHMTLAQMASIKKFKFNREISDRADLVSSIRKFGFNVPILLMETTAFGGKEQFVVDGQHRLETMIKMKKRCFAILMEYKPKTKEEVVRFTASLNSTQKKWTVSNYVDAYRFLDIKEYQILHKLKTKYPIYSYTTLSNLLKMSNRRSEEIGNSVKNGTFKILNLKKTLQCFQYASILHEYESITNRSVLALYDVMQHKKFNHKKFYDNYIKNIKKVKAEFHNENYLTIFRKWL